MPPRSIVVTGLVCLLLSSTPAAGQTRARYSARWVPALEDVASCPTFPRAFFGGCTASGRIDLHGRELRVTANLGAAPRTCSAYRERGGTAEPAWLLLHVTVLPPRYKHCFCPHVGCCQGLPKALTLVAPITANDGTISFRGTVPLQQHARVELRRVEIRAAGDCLQTDGIDFQTGLSTMITAGPALAVNGVGRLP